MAKLNKGPLASVDTVSCAAPGYCTAAGDYGDQAGGQAFAVTETKGTWGSAEELPGRRHSTRTATPVSSGCRGPRRATAVPGDSTRRAAAGMKRSWQPGERTVGHRQGSPRYRGPRRGTSGVGHHGVLPVRGQRSASGYYASSHLHWQAFVADETGGTWGSAEEVPGTAALNRGGDAQLLQVSCASTGNCGAGGYYTDSSGRQQVFVVSEAKGRWGTAENSLVRRPPPRIGHYYQHLGVVHLAGRPRCGRLLHRRWPSGASLPCQ